MPNRKLAPRVTTRMAHLPHRQRRRGRRGGGGGWVRTIEVAWLLEHFRRRRSRSSPSVRQIMLTAVGAGLTIMVIRAVTGRVKSRGTGAPAGAQDEAPESASTAPTLRSDSVASDSKLTDRVQSEMFRRSDAPASATGSG